MPRAQFAHFVDPGRDRLGHHLEISRLRAARREFRGRVLFGRDRQQLPTGRHRHEDDSHRRQQPQHDRVQGHLRGARPEHLPRPGEDHALGTRRPQFHALRFTAARAPLRCPHLPVHRDAQSGRDRRARGQHLAHQRGPALLLSATGPEHRGRRQYDRQRLLPRCLQGAAHGIRRRGPEPPGRHPRRSGRVNTPLLEIDKLTVSAGGTPVLHGVSLTVNAREVHAIMGPNGSGKSTLAHVLAGRPGYQITGGTVLYKGADLLALSPEQRAREGLFLAFQYPVEIPGVSNVYFLKAALNAIRKHRGLPELDAMDFLALVKEKAKVVEIDEALVKRPVNEGFSGGEKKRNEIFQMAVLEPALAVLDETDSGLDIDALRIVAGGVNLLRHPERSMVVVTHYQRLLNYIVPDFVHVLVEGRIVRSGGKEMAFELDEKGYAWLEKEPAPAIR